MRFICILLTIILLLNISCSHKVYYCGFGADAEATQMEIVNSIVGLDENNISCYEYGHIQGKVMDASYFPIRDEMAYANVIFTDLSSNKKIGTVTNMQGFFLQELKSSTYKIEFRYVGYSNISIYNISLDKGDCIDLSIYLGSGKTEEKFWVNKGNRISVYQ